MVAVLSFEKQTFSNTLINIIKQGDVWTEGVF